MNQEDFELQLKVWKDLAISKQVLMQTAAKALGLPAECTSEELDGALKTTISKVNGLETELSESQAKAKEEIAALTETIEAHEKTIKTVTSERDEALTGKDAAEHRAEAGRATNSEELKKIKAQLADKQKEIKQITKVLADTPENVVKKMKALKKEKMDEANLRKKAEENARKQRKDKQTAEADLKESKALLEEAAKLATEVRDLHKFANEQYDKLAESVEDKKSLDSVPALNEKLLEALEANSSDDDKEKTDKKAK